MRYLHLVCVQLCLTLVAIFAAGIDCADADTPPHVLVIYPTKDGIFRKTLRLHKLRNLQLSAAGDRAKALQHELGKTDVTMTLINVLGCRHQETAEDCANLLSVVPDTELSTTLSEIKTPTVMVLSPAAWFDEKEHVYFAHARIAVWELRPVFRQLKSFTLSYREFECAGACIQEAYTQSLAELAAMEEYMLDLPFGRRLVDVPPSWKNQPMLQDSAKWTNKCLRPRFHEQLFLLREEAQRAWSGEAAGRFGPSLDSFKWSGCTSS